MLLPWKFNKHSTLNTVKHFKFDPQNFTWMAVTLPEIFILFTGAPEKCGSEIPQNFTCSAGSEITGNVTLFGKPFPRLTWTISGKKINGTVDTRNADQHQYTYSFKTKVSSAMCGKRIKYEAVGHKNETVKGNSMILMSSCKFVALLCYFSYSLDIYFFNNWISQMFKRSRNDPGSAISAIITSCLILNSPLLHFYGHHNHITSDVFFFSYWGENQL